MSQLEKKAKKARYKLHQEDILRNAKALYTGTNVILDAFEKRVFIAKGRSYVEARSESDNTNDEDDFSFETPREVIPDFNIDRLYEERYKDEQPDTTDMPDLESKESAAQKRNQPGRGLKMPNQMLIRLPISLAQLNAGNNSEKLKNEIKQLLYSFYSSKKLTKKLYKSLIDII